MAKTIQPPTDSPKTDVVAEATPEPTPFVSVFELDGTWALRVNGVTAMLPPRNELSGLPTVGLLQVFAGVVNKAMGT